MNQMNSTVRCLHRFHDIAQLYVKSTGKSKELTYAQIDRGNVANNYFQASCFGVPNVTYR